MPAAGRSSSRSVREGREGSVAPVKAFRLAKGAIIKHVAGQKDDFASHEKTVGVRGRGALGGDHIHVVNITVPLHGFLESIAVQIAVYLHAVFGKSGSAQRVGQGKNLIRTVNLLKSQAEDSAVIHGGHDFFADFHYFFPSKPVSGILAGIFQLCSIEQIFVVEKGLTGIT